MQPKPVRPGEIAPDELVLGPSFEATDQKIAAKAQRIDGQANALFEIGNAEYELGDPSATRHLTEAIEREIAINEAATA